VTTAGPDRIAQFEADIAASPEAMARLLAATRAPDLGGRERFALTGLGSSSYAAAIVASAVRARGGSAWVDVAAAGGTAPADDLVLFAISASGRTPEIIDAAARHRGRSLVVAVTNAPGSPLAAVADIVMSLHAGEETAGIAGRSFRATTAALAIGLGLATADDLRGVPDSIADRLATAAARHAIEPMAAALDRAGSIDVVAPAPLVGLAEQAALMLREAPRLSAHAFETGDWLHTGVYLALPGHRVVSFPGSAADAEVVATVERRGGAVVTVASAGLARSPIERAIVDSVVAEQLAAALWRRASATEAG
jgi:fructoselysine-6-P-deglycase FrlB-like protein